MRVGLDIDGVLANFFSSYERVFIEVTGRNLFGSNRWPEYKPDTWGWPQERFGYTDEEATRVWDRIRKDEHFWATQSSLPGMETAKRLSGTKHDLYFITDRPGQGAKAATENWLRMVGGFYNPTVLISKYGKGPIVLGLGLDVYIDDKVENILDVQTHAPLCRAYLSPIYPYARNNPGFNLCNNQVSTVEEVFWCEKL